VPEQVIDNVANIFRIVQWNAFNEYLIRIELMAVPQFHAVINPEYRNDKGWIGWNEEFPV
jgi:hypothetical protein